MPAVGTLKTAQFPFLLLLSCYICETDRPAHEDCGGTAGKHCPGLLIATPQEKMVC